MNHKRNKEDNTMNTAEDKDLYKVHYGCGCEIIRPLPGAKSHMEIAEYLTCQRYNHCPACEVSNRRIYYEVYSRDGYGAAIEADGIQQAIALLQTYRTPGLSILGIEAPIGRILLTTNGGHLLEAYRYTQDGELVLEEE